ncbi:uncharacterized protein LOC105444949 [Strongylocentrotus purpuratus]|uniref:Myb/SANT-like DNA-binding domain-containing protein n=1 Tax=Strongylocentrotus purpuratus TaxID=7668 RepID=A0A7M7T2Y1_STRPU|nr:uncharacterized protein LOC105444949 [Strongylocentrotus purpuratus]
MVKRRPNLTDRDVRCLADYVKKNRQALFGKAGNCVEKIKKRKEDAWALGLVSLEAQGLQPGRTVKDLRLTWNEMAAKARKYRDAKNKTGKLSCLYCVTDKTVKGTFLSYSFHM